MSSTQSRGTNHVVSGRQNQLDGLRGLAAASVVVAHGIVTFDFALFSGSARDSIVPWDIYLSGAPFLLPMAGNLPVCIFFALSGYVLSHSFSNTDLGPLALLFKRYTRFTLPILSACVISYALLACGLMANQRLAVVTKSAWLAHQMQQVPSLSQALQDGLYRALVHLTPVPTPYDSVLWTMCIEFWGSVMLIAIFFIAGLLPPGAMGRERARVILLVVAGVVGCTSYLGLFAYGALFNLTQFHRRVRSGAAALLLALGLFMGTIPYSAVPWSIVRPFIEWPLPTVPGIPFTHTPITFFHSLGAILVLIAANSFLPFRRMLSSRPFRFLGRISFPLYLIHIPLLMSVVCSCALGLLHFGMPYAWMAALSLALFFAVSLSAATVLLFVCEGPSITLSGWVGVATDRLVRRMAAFALRRPIPRSEDGRDG